MRPESFVCASLRYVSHPIANRIRAIVGLSCGPLLLPGTAGLGSRHRASATDIGGGMRETLSTCRHNRRNAQDARFDPLRDASTLDNVLCRDLGGAASTKHDTMCAPWLCRRLAHKPQWWRGCEPWRAAPKHPKAPALRSGHQGGGEGLRQPPEQHTRSSGQRESFAPACAGFHHRGAPSAGAGRAKAALRASTTAVPNHSSSSG